MNEHESGLEVKVGLFMLVGLALILSITVYFGLRGEGYKSYYHVTVKLPDANGLIKGADVMLAGAKIGFIDQKPVLDPNIGWVAVSLKIYSNVKIPKQKTRFEVDSAGLLGDKFIKIALDPYFDPSKFNPNDPSQYWPDGAVIEGSSSGGLEELQATGNKVMKQLSAELDQLKIVLSDTNVGNLTDTFANLKTTSSNFVDVSQKVKGVVQNVNGVVEDAKGTIDAAHQTMATANSAAGDLRNAIADARKVMGDSRGALQKATEGNGLIATLLNDRELAENIRRLIANLRTHGILFYHDTPPRERQQPAAAPGSHSGL